MWFSIALFHDMTAGGRISARLIQIFHLPFSLLALLLTAWLAGLLAGLAATTGFYLRATLSANHMPWGK